jgi:hypothetical protein
VRRLHRLDSTSRRGAPVSAIVLAALVGTALTLAGYELGRAHQRAAHERYLHQLWERVVLRQRTHPKDG